MASTERVSLQPLVNTERHGSLVLAGKIALVTLVAGACLAGSVFAGRAAFASSGPLWQQCTLGGLMFGLGSASVSVISIAKQGNMFQKTGTAQQEVSSFLRDSALEVGCVVLQGFLGGAFFGGLLGMSLRNYLILHAPVTVFSVSISIASVSISIAAERIKAQESNPQTPPSEATAGPRNQSDKQSGSDSARADEISPLGGAGSACCHV